MISSPPRLTVAIVGAGFAGLATAALLARAGHRVRVIDKFSKPDSIGAGILIQPSGIAAMRVLGIDEEILSHGARVNHLYGVTRRRWPIVNIKYDDWQAGSFGVGLHRGVLFNALWRLAHEAGAQSQTGQDVCDLAALKAGHDLVVIADGCRSSLRVQTGLASSDRVYPWGAVWAVLRDPQHKYGKTLWQWYRGAKQMLGIMPTGNSPRGVNVVSLFWSLRADRYEAFRKAGIDSFKRDVLQLNPDCGELLDQLQSMDDLTWARYHDVVMPAYHGDRCVVIGDAAHATSPQLGQGTNLALLDAVVLAECLEQPLPLAESLARYTQLRSKHLRFYGQASRWLTPLFQSDDWLLPFGRTLFMNLASKAPLVGRITRETLVGVRQDWTSRTTLAMPGQPEAVPPLATIAAAGAATPPFAAAAPVGPGQAAC
ncbi:MAG: FAD-dependent monooxygenase [Ramlibacter sp.]|nr:FAD-dependent monooxygenase [Ramlibacter sp.]